MQNNFSRLFSKSWTLLANAAITLTLVLTLTPTEGPSGSIGSSGASGMIGATGPSGPTGPAGSQGEPGVAGSSGATGPVGPIGPIGPSGNTGATGPQGEPGIPGTANNTVMHDILTVLPQIGDSAAYAANLVNNEGYIAIDSFTTLALIGTSNQYPLNGKYVLTSDLDFSTYGSAWTPIPGPFKGTFDGAGYGLLNFASPAQPYDQDFALFDVIGDIQTYQVTSFKNFFFDDAVIRTNRNAATLAIEAYYMVIVDNVYVNTSLIQSDFVDYLNNQYQVGGLVVDVQDSIIVRGSAISDSTIVSKSGDAGGFFAESEYVQMERTYSLANTISGLYRTGGLIGNSEGGALYEVANTSFVYSGATRNQQTSSYTGGLIGREYSRRGLTIKNSFNTGTVMTNADYAGGIIGYFDNDSYASGIIENTFNSGNVYGNEYVGGLFGDLNAETQLYTNVYNSGQIEGTYRVGGLIGYVGSGDERNFNFVYNSGTVTSSDGRVGGLFGEVNGGTNYIYFSFNVGTVVNTGPSREFGQIFGRNNDDVLMKDGYYYWDGISPVRWADEGPGAGQSGNPFIARMETDLERFTQFNKFVYKDVWNFQTVWEFDRVEGYPYPTIMSNRHFTTVQEVPQPLVFQNLILGEKHGFAFDTSGTLYAWGTGDDGQLGRGNGGNIGSPLPVFLPLNQGETMVNGVIAPGERHTLFLTSDNRVLATGWNGYSQLGDNTFDDKNIPEEVSFSLNQGEFIIDIKAGSNHNLALTSTGRIFAWGRNNLNQLGLDTQPLSYARVPTEVPLPQVPQGETITSILARGNMSAAISNLGTIYTWGNNFTGSLGHGHSNPVATPTPITFNGLAQGESVNSLVLGHEHMLAYTSADRILVWGDNSFGQLGFDPNVNSQLTSPTVLPFTLNQGETIQQLVAGSYFTMVLTSTGRLFAFGQNSYYQLGNNTQNNSSTPTLVTMGLNENETIVRIGAMNATGFAITSENRLFAWGLNGDRQIPTSNLRSVNEFPRFIALSYTNAKIVAILSA